MFAPLFFLHKKTTTFFLLCCCAHFDAWNILKKKKDIFKRNPPEICFVSRLQEQLEVRGTDCDGLALRLLWRM